MVRARNNILTIAGFAFVSLSCALARSSSGINDGQKKYPVNHYLDSLLHTIYGVSNWISIAEIVDSPIISHENGKTVYCFKFQQLPEFKGKKTNTNDRNSTIPFRGPFTPYSTLRYGVTENTYSNTGLLTKGKKLIFFAKALSRGKGTIASTDTLELIGFVEATKKNIHYIQHTFLEKKSDGEIFLYHTDKKPRKDRNNLSRKEHYWTYYENGHIQKESIRLNKLTIGRILNQKGKKRLKVFYVTHRDKRSSYYENGIPKEKTITKYKYDLKTGGNTTTYDTLRFDTSGKIIYHNQQTKTYNNKNSF